MPAYLSALIVLAAAQSGGDTAARVVDELFACRAITVDADRLACFDRAAATMSTARDRKEIVIVDQAAIKKTRRSLFGFTLPRIDLFGGGKDDKDVEEVKELDSTVAAVSQYGNGLWQVTLADGAVWRFTESMFTIPKAGDAIHIRRAALGSYFGAVRGKLGVRIKRER